MATVPLAILRHAEQLYRDGLKVYNEVLGRAIVNRCYYASYNHVLNAVVGRMKLKLVKVKDGGSHERLIETCATYEYPETDPAKAANDKRIARIAQDLSAIRSLRVLADYGLDENLSQTIVIQSIKLANDICSAMDRCPK